MPALRAPPGTDLEKEVKVAVDDALNTFVEGTLGTAEEWSKKVRKKVPVSRKSAATSIHGKASPQEVVDVDHPRKSVTFARPVDGANGRLRAEEGASAVTDAITVSECGSDKVNGRYIADGVRDGVACYKQVGGEMTIERDSAPEQETQWCICQNYGFISYFFVDADSDLPPASGWVVGDKGVAPPPSLSGVGLVGAPVEVELGEAQVSDKELSQANGQAPVHVKYKKVLIPVGGGLRQVHAPGSVSARRKKRLSNAPKGNPGIKKKRRVKRK